VRAVLDEALPHKLTSLLRDAGCPVDRFPARWKGMQDSALLDVIEAEGCTVLVTCDRNMPFQQSFAGRSIAVVVVPGQRLQILAPLVDQIARTIRDARPGEVKIIDRTDAVGPSPA